MSSVRLSLWPWAGRARYRTLGMAAMLIGLGASVCMAASPDPVLSELIARAQKPLSPAESGGFSMVDQDQILAIAAIRDFREASAEDETKIVAALKALRQSPDPQLVRMAASTLGRRGHLELLKEFAAELSATDDEPAAKWFVSFAGSLPEKGEKPSAFLREGLAHPNGPVRKATIELVQKYQAKEFRTQLEEIVRADPKEANRLAAAETLVKLGCRESAPALERAYRGSERARSTIAKAVAALGGEIGIEALAPLLHSKSEFVRQEVVAAIAKMPFRDPQPAADALFPLLESERNDQRFQIIAALGHLKDPRVIPVIRELGKHRKSSGWGNREVVIRALGAIGNDEAVEMLNAMDFDQEGAQGGALEQELLRLARPSSAYAAWDAYLCDATKLIPGQEDPGTVNRGAMTVLEKLADEEIFKAMRMHESWLREGSVEWETLGDLIDRIAPRFPQAAEIPVEKLTTKAEVLPADRDHDGVPDRLDKYPDDPRRSQDIPVVSANDALSMPVATYVAIPLATEGPASKPMLFLAMGARQCGWLTKVNDADPPDYHVACMTMGKTEEWPLPNPGGTPGIYRLQPMAINASGTVIGTATRRKVAIPLHDDVREAHLSYQSGFVFERGRLRFDPAPPFTPQSLNVSYRLINNRGLIFGHREVRVREKKQEILRTCAFLGDHVFREVPSFDASVLTQGGQLLCTRVEKAGVQSFVWDGSKFMDLGSLAGRPADVRAFAMNEKVQVIGRSDAVDQDGCPTGFFWEDGQIRAFSELIPKESRGLLRSAIPFRFDIAGNITFRAEEKVGPDPAHWPKHNFILRHQKDGSYSLSVQMINGIE